MRPKAMLLILGAILLHTGLSALINQRLEGVDSLTVGSRFKLIIEADFAINRIVVPDTLKSFEVLSTQRKSEGGSMPRYELSIVALRPGSLTFPALELVPSIAGEQRQFTDRFRVNVLKVRADGDEVLRNIKPPRRYRFQKPLWLYLLALILASAAAIWLLVRSLRKARKPVRIATTEATKPQPIKLAPWELALQRLEALLKQGLPEQGRQTEFHFKIAQILRAYLEQVYRFPALEMTTVEITRQLRTLDIGRQTEIRRFFQACDLIKFARAEATQTDITERIEWLRDYLKHQDPLYRTISINEETKTFDAGVNTDVAPS